MYLGSLKLKIGCYKGRRTWYKSLGNKKILIIRILLNKIKLQNILENRIRQIGTLELSDEI